MTKDEINRRKVERALDVVFHEMHRFIPAPELQRLAAEVLEMADEVEARWIDLVKFHSEGLPCNCAEKCLRELHEGEAA